jgi:hypothetical protein
MQWIDDGKDPEGSFLRYGLRYTAVQREDLTKAFTLAAYVWYPSKKGMDDYNFIRIGRLHFLP